VGAEAARRAQRVVGSPLVTEPPFVVELVPDANVAAGEHEHGLAALWPGATGVRLAPGSERVDPPGDRPLVVVARDLARHAWQRELVQAWPQAIVLETGLPGAPGVDLLTHGAGRVNLEAAVETLRVPSFE
jgi:beta-N-acetylhexosaminidase